MQIRSFSGAPRFPSRPKNPGLGHLLKTRLSQEVVFWPEQAISLAGYMCWPNDKKTRERLTRILRSWSDGTKTTAPKLPRIQHRWLRVADIFHLHYDIAQGQHQARRGGASVGKAIALAATNAKSWGTAEATLWSVWKAYKDVAHLVSAAVIVCAEARIVGRQNRIGLSVNQFLPFQMVMLAPDLVLAVALNLQQYGLKKISASRKEPTLNARTVWRIPKNINVNPILPPVRKIRPADVVVLNARRAGNRGRANRRKTTPVLTHSS